MNSPMPIASSARIGSSRSSIDDRSATPASPETPEHDGFGRHFDAARRQGGRKADAGVTSASAPASPSTTRKAPAAADQASSSSKSSDADGKDGGKSDDKTKKAGDGQSLAVVMLDLFGAAKQALPKSAAPGSAGAGAAGAADLAGTMAAATAGTGWPLATMASAAAGVAKGVVDAATQTIDDNAAGDTTQGDGTNGTSGGLAAMLAAASSPQVAGAMAHAAGADALAPHQDNQSSTENMAMNGLAAGMPQVGTSPVHALNVAAPAGSTPFAQELGQQIIWLGGQTLKQANIRLNPEQLGSLDVKVSVTHDGHVDVSFTAQHPAAVTAVQQSLGQLNLMLAGQGLSLGQAQVGQQGAGQHGGTSGRRDTASEADTAIDSLAPMARHAISIGLLDTFA